MSKNFTKNKIEEIRKMATIEIPALLSTGKVDPKEYKDKRLQMNKDIIQALIGGEFIEPKKDGNEWKIKFCKKLPNRSELAEIIAIVDVFTRTLEEQFFDQLQQATMMAGDMSIPSSADLIVNAGSGLPKIEKINNKKLRDYIFGYDGNEAVGQLMLNASDCMMIAAAGEDLRKKSNRNKMFMVGGIALLLVGGTAAAIVIHKHRKGEKIADMDIDMSDIGDVDVDDMDVSIDDDDAPIVTID